MEQGYLRSFWEAKTRIDTLEGEVDSLTNTVESLQARVAEFEGWRGVAEIHVTQLEDVVLQHHPESYKDLGYTLNEDEAHEEEAPRGPAPDESPAHTGQ